MTDPAGPRSFAPHLWFLLMNAIWGLSYVGIKVSLEHLAPFAVVAGRFWLAVPCLVPFLLREGGLAALRRTAKTGTLTGAAMLTGYLLQTAGMAETTASMGGFLAGLIVLLVALGGCAFLGDKLRATAGFGLALGLCGLILLCTGGGDDGGRNTTRGILLQVGSSCAYAGHVLLLSRLSPRGDEMGFALWQLLVVAIGGTLALGVTGEVAAAGTVLHFDWALIAALAYLGILATGIGVGVQSVVQPQIRPTHVALMFATQPLFAALGGALVLGDRLGGQQLLGGLMIVAGVVVAARR